MNGQRHAYAGILSGGFLPEGEGDPMKETDQVEQRGEEMWVTASKTLGIGWSFLQGVGAPKEILLSGPSPSLTDTTTQEHLTRELEVVRTVDVWCTSCGGRFTVRCPVCESGVCWFCVKSNGCLTCEICEHKAELSGSWTDGTKLVEDSLSENSHLENWKSETDSEPEFGDGARYDGI